MLNVKPIKQASSVIVVYNKAQQTPLFKLRKEVPPMDIDWCICVSVGPRMYTIVKREHNRLNKA